MLVSTIEQIAQQLLLNKIPFSYNSGSVTVNNNQDKMPAFTACYHSQTGKLIVTDGDNNIITKHCLIEFIEHA